MNSPGEGWDVVGKPLPPSLGKIELPPGGLPCPDTVCPANLHGQESDKCRTPPAMAQEYPGLNPPPLQLFASASLPVLLLEKAVPEVDGF